MRSRQRLRNIDAEENFWPSFTDMISTIAIILFFLILIIFIKNIIIANEFNAKNAELIDAENALTLRAEEMAVLNAEISDRETNLMLLQTEADELKAEVEQGQIALTLSQAQIIDQQVIIANSNLELGDMRTKIESIALIRLDILDQVRQAIEEELKNTSISNVENQVLIGDNGNIVLNNTLLFGKDSSSINEAGKVVLDELSNVFKKVLDDEDLRQYIDAIQIEGHTDKVNTAEYNRRLSSDRAISVVDYLMNTNKLLENNYGQYFVASAFSEYRPLVLGNTEEKLAQNRRIEISIILKDSNIQKIVDDYLNETSDYFEDPTN